MQLRLLASAILFRACLRAFPRKPTPEEKMALHQHVEHAAWNLPARMLDDVRERDVDDGIPDGAEWSALAASLVQKAEAAKRPQA